MLISDVMDQLGEALSTIDGLRVTPYYADRITPPAAIVGWPDDYDYDSTYGRGSDSLVMPLTVLVGKSDARSNRDTLSAYVDGSGESSVKQAIEAYTATAYDSARVTRVEFGVVPVAGVEFLAATFDVEIVGTGG